MVHTQLATAPIERAPAGRHRPGAAWYVLACLATVVGGYGLALRDGRPARDAVPGWPWLDEVHFATGGLALLVGVWCFRRDLLARAPHWHRRLGWLYVVAVAASSAAGLVMGCFSMGGLPAHLGFVVLAVLWPCFTLLGLLRIHRRDVLGHRRCMVLSYSLAAGAIALRFELPLLVMATGSFQLAYPLVAWLAWVPNLAWAWWWLSRTDVAGRVRR